MTTIPRRVLRRLDPRWVLRGILRRFRGRRFESRLRRQGWYDPGARSDAPAIFIGGCWRSGTTLLREILGRHSRLAAGPETQLFVRPFRPKRIAEWWTLDRNEVRTVCEASEHLVDFADRFYGRLLEAEGAERWIDKAPENVEAIPALLSWFPRGRFLHVLRDGRDVVSSLRHYPRERLVAGRVEPTRRKPRPIDWCSKLWVTQAGRGLAFAAHPRCLEVRYEALVDDPEREIRRVCEFLGEDFEPGMIEPSQGEASMAGPRSASRLLNNPDAAGEIHRHSVGRWRRDLDRAERETVRDVAGALLVATGYVTDHGWVGEG